MMSITVHKVVCNCKMMEPIKTTWVLFRLKVRNKDILLTIWPCIGQVYWYRPGSGIYPIKQPRVHNMNAFLLLQMTEDFRKLGS